MTLDDDMLLPLAENLLAAVVAYRLRISLNYALSRYVRGERPGQYCSPSPNKFSNRPTG